jgi:Ca-activated chloride channel family protein
MNDADFLPDPLGEETGISRQNVERLIGRAYNPEPAGADFARRVQASVRAAARERAGSAPTAGYRVSAPARLRSAARLGRPPQTPEEIRLLRRTLAWVLSAAAMLAAVLLAYHALRLDSDSPGRTELAFERRTPLPLGPASQAEPLAVGQEVRTAARDKRRLRLPDGSLLYLNQNAHARLEADRLLAVVSGEVFLEVAAADRPFRVRTPDGEMSARGTKFAVAAQPGGSRVLVVQGQVAVGEVVLRAGEELAAGAAQAQAVPHAAHRLAWLRELLPDSLPRDPHVGGALVAVAADGRETSLDLRRLHIDVLVEEGFARTTIDQTWLNVVDGCTEGTFVFPLPAEATVTQLALVVDGRRQELADAAAAGQTGETGTARLSRTIPLEAGKEKRIIVTYLQPLAVVQGRARYSLPTQPQTVADWSFRARIRSAGGMTVEAGPGLELARDRDDLLLAATARQVRLDCEVHFWLAEPGGTNEESARFALAEQDGDRYLLVRYRPAWPPRPAGEVRPGRDWVFLFESSADRDPLLARAQVEVVRAILANAEPEDTFAVLTAGTRVRVFPGEGGGPASVTSRRVTAENIRAALEFLEQTHLVGALDLGSALWAAAEHLRAARNPYLVHVGSGIPALGERRDDVLLRALPERARYVGIAVGQRGNRRFMQAAAERSAGYFARIDPGEPIGWRGFELMSALNTPRWVGVQVEDGGDSLAGRPTTRFLPHSTVLAQGEELVAVARLQPAADTSPLPDTITLTGSLDGRWLVRHLPVRNVVQNVGCLPQAWAAREIDRLRADDAERDRVTELAKSIGIYLPDPERRTSQPDEPAAGPGLSVPEDLFQGLPSDVNVLHERPVLALPETHPALAWFRDLCRRCAADNVQRRDWDEALDFIGRNRHNPLGWALLCQVHERRLAKADPQLRLAELAEAWRLFESDSPLGYAASYERARCLLLAGQRRAARRLFGRLHARTLATRLPAIDAAFREALGRYGADRDEWPELMEAAARQLSARDRRLEIVGLAWQAALLNDSPLADRLLPLALAGVEDHPQHPAVTLAAIRFRLHHRQAAQADQLLQSLLGDPRWAGDARLWRLGAFLAEQQNQPERVADCLERALDFRRAQEAVNHPALRQDCRTLLEHYHRLAAGAANSRLGSRDLAARIVRAADRWRLLEPDQPAPCILAARALAAAGEEELAWDYLTTPLARRPSDSGPWLALASTLAEQGQPRLADRAYAAACAAEPANADLLGLWAEHLERAGSHAEARAIYRRLADGPWPPRYHHLQQQARFRLGR